MIPGYSRYPQKAADGLLYGDLHNLCGKHWKLQYERRYVALEIESITPRRHNLIFHAGTLGLYLKWGRVRLPAKLAAR